ncbi:MAG TPA: universal stress protein [Acidimicrobiia bacterium]|jgi:nucleotide-binding universal stress UspA family protein|nr:universal stress protein [Acidimicrobiia bacterium]
MDWNPKAIVVGVDGSDTSIRAAGIATEIARSRQAKLILVTVVRPPEGWWGIGGAPPTPEALSAALVEGQQQVIRETEEQLPLDGMDYETVEELGDPTSRLIAVAEERDAGLIVIGKRGAGLAERVMLGSVADRLCHHSPVPVMVVP